MTAALSHQVTLTERELQTLAFRLGIHDLPVVLAVRPRHATVESRDAATNRATQELVSRNLIADDEVHPDLVSVLRALQRPDRELAMRLVTPDGTARVSAVRRGSLGVLARRIGDDISLRTIGESGELRDMAAALLAELPQAKPAEIQPVGAPLSEMSECLSGTHDSVGFADRIRALGAESKAAMLLGAALASRQAFAEIVHYALADDEGRISRSPGGGGRCSTPSVGASSVHRARRRPGSYGPPSRPGSDHAVVDAIGRLVELCDEGRGAYRAS